MLTLLRGLCRNYFRLHLVCTLQCAERLRPDLPPDVELIPLRLQKSTHVAAALRFRRILLERQVAILHSHLFRASLFASPIGRLCRVPVIVETPHVREAWRKGWLKRSFAIDRLVGRFVDHYIAVSEANARCLVEQKALPIAKIVVIHNGCDLQRFGHCGHLPADLKKSLSFDISDPVLVVIGRLEPQKGHSLLLEALPTVRREFPQVRLVCVGEGSLQAELERQAEELGLAHCVRFVGYQSNIPDWLALADMTVLPSFYEGLPIVAIESLAAGKPVVATAVDGTPEVVVNEKTGLTIPPGDVQRLAEAICRLLRQPEWRQSLGRAGREWVRERFAQERQVRLTEEFYLRAWEQYKRAQPIEARRVAAEAPQ